MDEFLAAQRVEEEKWIQMSEAEEKEKQRQSDERERVLAVKREQEERDYQIARAIQIKSIIEEQERKAAYMRKFKEEYARFESPRKAARLLHALDPHAKVQTAQQIKAFCEERQIEAVFHFTRIENIHNILENGILDRQTLEWQRRYPKVKFNDPVRQDGHPEAICLSIGFPNYMKFDKYSQNIQDDWCVIELIPEILLYLDCAFFPTNAAKFNNSHVSLKEMKSFESLKSLFSDRPGVQRVELRLPDFFPTDPEAEVLSFDPIPSVYIRTLNFYSKSAKRRWEDSLEEIPAYPFLHVEKQYFAPRNDYKFWRNNDLHDNDFITYVPEPEFSDEWPECHEDLSDQSQNELPFFWDD